MAFLWQNPQCNSLILAHGLDAPQAWMDRPRLPRASHGLPGRDAIRVVLPGESAGGVLVVKREHRPRWPRRFGRLLRIRWPESDSRRELGLLLQLGQRGVAVPQPVACWERSGAWGPSLLAVCEPADAVALCEFLPGWSQAPHGDTRAALWRRLADAVARCHAAGACHGQLTSRNVLVRWEQGEPHVVLRNWQDGILAADVSLKRRAHDLAMLWATLSPRWFGDEDRNCFAEAYAASSGWSDRLHELQRQIEAAQQALLRKRRIFELHEAGAAQAGAAAPLEALDSARMWVDRRFRSALESAGLLSFSQVMQTTRGRLIRALDDRENWRLELHDAHGAPRGAYLKKHHVRTPFSVVRAKLGAGPGHTAGRAEARNVTRLARGGVGNMQLVAFGEKLHRDGRLESFVLTEELAQYEQLDYFVKDHFPPLSRGPRCGELTQLVDQVAELVSRFHRLGYNHRDLYCCHLFVRREPVGAFQVNLIDLQRVEYRRWLRGRWIVKDLAQLAYSAPRAQISRTMKLRFFKRYLGAVALTAEHKRLIRRVLAKQRRMERSLGLHP